MKDPVDFLVVGGGPAGLMAAITAARTGSRGALVERLPRPGTKLVATGGGRCNLTNVLSKADYLGRFGRQGRFMRPALDTLDAAGLRAFFRLLGIETHCADGFHVFPVSESAVDIRDALLACCRELQVEMHTAADVTALTLRDGAIAGVETSQDAIVVPRVILAAGGCAWPALGSNGSGFALAQGAGHTVVAPVPALVPLVTQQTWLRRCAGIVIPGARLRIDLPKASKLGITGDLLFTHRGLSGPAALDLSGEVARLLEETGKPVPVRLHLTPETNVEAWSSTVGAWRTEHPRRLMRNLVSLRLQHSLAEVVCAETGIGADLRAAELPRAVQRRLAEWLAGVTVDVVDTEGFGKAMVSAGGVSTREVDPRTLQSRIVKGLYFAGEVLDIDGPCGGYNLQWAFSSGKLAGQECSHDAGHPVSFTQTG